jgi:hypothetical protein
VPVCIRQLQQSKCLRITYTDACCKWRLQAHYYVEHGCCAAAAAAQPFTQQVLVQCCEHVPGPEPQMATTEPSCTCASSLAHQAVGRMSDRNSHFSSGSLSGIRSRLVSAAGGTANTSPARAPQRLASR